MSHDQPGPPDQQPPAPAGVFGPPDVSGPQPFGQQGWGPPQQPHPFGQPSPYGAPGGFPGGFPPPKPASGKKTGLTITGVIAALALIAGGAYFALGGDSDGASTGDITVHSKGYKLVAPESVDAYTKSSPGSAPAELNAEQKQEAAAAGVNNAQAASGIYNAESTDPYDPAKVGGKRLTFDGLYGDIPDPATALDNYFANVTKKGFKGDGKARGLKMERLGSPRAVKPPGFDGALMKCQDVKVTHDKDASAPKGGAAEFQYPICAWSDYSTLGGASVFELAQAKTGGNGASQEEVAALTAELYRTARKNA
ncbi:hypothetical protein AB0940_24990 [Streptomyces sp. NPDC006656]|uniref:hypothetical protein n=1 Tax=Streptomyces sp. NPDC006656 TaxID=3156899 RepID=UPI003455E65C